MLPHGDVAVIYQAVLCVVLQPQDSESSKIGDPNMAP